MASRRATISKPTQRNLAFCVAALRRGEVVAVPTETVYGLAANALDPVACRKIFRAKGRPTRDPLIVHVANAADLDAVAQPNASARKLAARFWPGPLTLVLPKRPAIPDIVTAGLPSVAVRVPAHPVFRRLLRLTGLPLAAPSANRFGYISPTTAEHVRAGLGTRIRHILDGGPSEVGLESTILDLRDERRPRVLRPGAITREQLQKVLGKPIPRFLSQLGQKTGKSLIAPGMLKRHYSPRTPVVLHERILVAEIGGSRPDEAWVLVGGVGTGRGSRGAGRGAWGTGHGGLRALGRNVFVLNRGGSLAGAARNLFATLRTLDDGGYRKIHVELARGRGLAEAINDRLRRAAAHR